MIETEMIEKCAALVKDRLTKSEHEQMAGYYDELAKHYDDLAKEARRYAAIHRAIAQGM